MLRSRYHKKWFGPLALVVGFTLAPLAEAASVYKCRRSTKSHGILKCVIKVESGIVGDSAKILDEKAHIVAVGRLVKRKGAYAVMSIAQNKIAKKGIRSGYPVIVNVENRNSSMQWAASFSSKD